MELFSRTYGWTPKQIRDTSIQDIEDYKSIISIRNQIERAENKKQNRGR